MPRPSLSEALFTPRSIALIGASDAPGRNNSRTQLYLRKHGYTGAIYPVNPRRDEIYGEKCYPSVKDIPGSVDHAFVTTPPQTVPQVIRECGEAGVPVATVFTAEFAESGPEGVKLQQEVIDTARAVGVRLIGPNCMGIYNMDPPATIAPNLILELPELLKGNIGVVSHSGSLTGTFISRGQARGMGFSKIVSIGNESDISVAEIGEMLVDDPKTEAIMLFLETVRHADAFAAMARRAYAKGKPVMVYKLGRSAAAQEFTASHTGAIAGTDVAVDAFFRQHGVIRVNYFETLFELPMLILGREPKPGNRVSVVSTTGGGGGMIVDCLGVAGIDATAIPEARAKALYDEGAIFSNGPLIDLTFKGTRAENVSKVLDALVEMPECEGVVMVVGSSAQFHPELALKPFLNLKGSKKPLGAFLVPDAPESNRLLTDAGIAGFRTPEGCADAFRCALGWQPPIEVPETHASNIDAVVQAISAKPSGSLDEQESREIFDRLGVPQAASGVAKDDDEHAVAIAKDIGYPLVAKILSPDIAHKTEAGGVVLGIHNAAELAAAFETIRTRVTAYSKDARIAGFLLQKMEKGLGEVLLGYRHDPLIGPTVVLGTGGILSEVYGDVAIRVAPVSAETARGMIEEVKGLAPLRGYRGLPMGDLDALADAIVALSNLARLPDARIREAEINPLLVRKKGDGVVAVDGLVILG